MSHHNFFTATLPRVFRRFQPPPAGEDLRFRIVTLEVGIDDRDHAAAWPIRTFVSKIWDTWKISRDGEPWELDMLS